jgi:hypothetical protein
MEWRLPIALSSVTLDDFVVGTFLLALLQVRSLMPSLRPPKRTIT